MKRLFLLALVLCLAMTAGAQTWKAKWISSQKTKDQPNTWLNYRKVVDLPEIPSSVIAKIGADSKYWLWINNKMVVYEGALKRGPNPRDTYYDEVEIAPYLKKGENTIAVLMWYFGKPSFAHNDSGKAALIFDCQTPQFDILSDKTWRCEVNKAFGSCTDPQPNYRLAESNLLYDGRLHNDKWQTIGYDQNKMPKAVENGKAGDAPWNRLVKRPIPLLRFSDLRDYTSQTRSGDSLICTLPYNAQVTPYIKLKAKAGQKVTIMTDNYLVYNGGADYIRCEYITRDGEQEFENMGWINGHKMYYIIPEGAEVLDVKFRESGYDTDFTGTFECSDEFLNQFFKKAARTLYITMRDTYMDCPDRERSQWTGDVVNESGEAFYALSPTSQGLAKKWLHEICDWQRADGTFYAPVPSSSWNQELPAQIMATVGYYGLWNYYLNTGDRETIEKLYPAVKRYIAVWEKDEAGNIIQRSGDWNWGDWGENIDRTLLQNAWYDLMIKGMRNIAQELGYPQEAQQYQDEMDALKKAFNATYWTGTEYRDPKYTEPTDDRGQALAVVSGLADTDKYPALLEVFRKQEHASPYMEKYVYEALMQMGYEDDALMRNYKRFSKMIFNRNFTTLFEGWGIGAEGYGGGTVNHAWSGGGLTIGFQYICGIAPVEPAYKTISILPQPGYLSWAKASSQSVIGRISSAFENDDKSFRLTAEIPAKAKGIIGAPAAGVKEVQINGTTVWKDGKYVANSVATDCNDCGTCCKGVKHLKFGVKGGDYKLVALK